MIAKATGGIVVALAIFLEIIFGELSSNKERSVSEWYALRVAELNLRAEAGKRGPRKARKRGCLERLNPPSKSNSSTNAFEGVLDNVYI
jgi:hypothetical protein